MRSAVGYEPACGLSRNLRDIKEQFLLCAAELTPQNTRPHGCRSNKASAVESGASAERKHFNFPPPQSAGQRY